jgi:hypothetical protein
MKRLILPSLVTFIAMSAIYSYDVNIVMKDGTVLRGNMLGHTPDVLYLEQTNGQAVPVNVNEIKFVFDAGTGNQIDLTPAVPTESTTAEQDQEPDMVVIPDTDAYYYYYDGYDCFFYGGYWWRPWHGFWYRSRIYSGGWILVNNGHVPYIITHLPPGWRAGIYRDPRIGWVNVRSHWQEWSRENFWANQSRNAYARPSFHQNYSPSVREQGHAVNNSNGEYRRH